MDDCGHGSQSCGGGSKKEMVVGRGMRRCLLGTQLEARCSDQSLTPHIHRRPSGVPEGDLRSPLLPYYLRQRDALRRLVQKQEAENQQLAEQVLAGRRQVEELQLQCRARHQTLQVSE